MKPERATSLEMHELSCLCPFHSLGWGTDVKAGSRTLPRPRGLTLPGDREPRTQRHLYGEALLLVRRRLQVPQQGSGSAPTPAHAAPSLGAEAWGREGDPQRSGVTSFNQRSSLSSLSELGKLL